MDTNLKKKTSKSQDSLRTKTDEEFTIGFSPLSPEERREMSKMVSEILDRELAKIGVKIKKGNKTGFCIMPYKKH